MGEKKEFKSFAEMDLNGGEKTEPTQNDGEVLDSQEGVVPPKELARLVEEFLGQPAVVKLEEEKPEIKKTTNALRRDVKRLLEKIEE